MLSDYFNRDIFGVTERKNNIKMLEPLVDSYKNIIMVSGHVSSGKTMLAKKIANQHEGTVLYIDTNNTINNVMEFRDTVFISKTNRLEQILEMLREAPKTVIDLVIVDDIANILMEDEKDRAKEFHSMIVKIADCCAKCKSQLILINQMNVIQDKPYGFSYQLERLIGADIRIRKQDEGPNFLYVFLENKKNKERRGASYEL